MPKNPKIISVNLALDLIKETSFFNKRCTDPWKFCEVKKNSHKNMVEQEKLPSMFAGGAGVELKSERRIEKISTYNGVLTPQTKITSLKLLKYPPKLGEFLILLNSAGGMGDVGAWVHRWCGGCGSKSVSGVGQNFGMGGVGLKRFV